MNLSFWLAVAGAALAAGYALAIVLRRNYSVTRCSFLLGLLALGVEAGFMAMCLRADSPAEELGWHRWRLTAMAFIGAPWILFSMRYARGDARRRPLWRNLALAAIGLLPVSVAVLFRDDFIVAIRISDYAFQSTLTLGWPALVVHGGLLISAVVVLMNLERTYRAAIGTIRWRIKFMLLGLGLLFIVRVYTSSQALILRVADPGLLAINAGALLAACIVMARTLARSGHFEMDVYPSPAVLRNSVTLVLVGIYLVLVGLVSKLAAAIGTENTLGFNAFLILLSIVGLAIALQSDRVQLHLRRFVSRNFQRPFYDYRTAWRSFTDVTARQLDQRSLSQAIVRQVADLFQAKSVSVWLVEEAGEGLRCSASSAMVETAWAEAAPDREGAASVAAWFQKNPDPIEFDDASGPWADVLRRCHPKLFELGGQRVAVPLASRGTFLGVMIVGDRVSGGGFGVQDVDMIRCVADHVSGSLLTLQLSAKLLQSRELEAFQTMAAFFVHDLKNAASTLNLMLPNLPIHWENPEFREDTLRGITKTVGHINALIRRLSELRHELKLQPRPTDVVALMERAAEGWKGVGDVQLVKDWQPVPKISVDPEQVLTVVTNLILNARDATLEGPAKPGRVEVSLRQQETWVVITVRDNGCGMSPAFLAQSLFKPFQTTKKNGLGIGMFQSKMIVEAHGGRMVVKSEQGKGTTFEVFLPVAAGPS